jgi:putative redox protein
MYAQRHGWQLDDLRVDVRTVDTNGERRVERMLTFAREQPREQRARLAEIAEKTPVTLLLRSGIPIDTTVAAD